MAFKFYPSEKVIEIGKIREKFLDSDISNIPKEPGEIYGIVYAISNDFNDKLYIGSTVHYTERANTYIRDYYDHKVFMGHRPINTAIREHGIEHFRMRPIFICNSEKSLRSTELEFIKSMNTMEPNGYNTKFGTTPLVHTAQIKQMKSRPMIAISLVDKKVYFSDSGKLLGIAVFNNLDRSVVNASARKGITYHDYYFFYWSEEEIRSAVQRKIDQYTNLIGKRSGCIPGRMEEYKQVADALLDEGTEFLRNNDFKAYRIEYSDTEKCGYAMYELSL